MCRRRAARVASRWVSWVSRSGGGAAEHGDVGTWLSRSLCQHLATASRYNYRLAADVVIVPIARGPTGAPTATASSRGERDVRDQARPVVPTRSAPHPRRCERVADAFGPRAGVGLFSKERPFRSTPEQCRDCTRMRDSCRSVVDEVRSGRAFDERRSHGGGRTPRACGPGRAHVDPLASPAGWRWRSVEGCLWATSTG
jgi:hypothetical protein